MDSHNLFASALSSANLGTLVVSLWCMLTKDSSVTEGFLPWCFVLYSPAVYLANMVYLGKERNKRDWVLLNLLPPASVFAVLYFLFPSASLPSHLVRAGILVLLSFRALSECQKPIVLRTCLRWFDISSLFLIIIFFLAPTLSLGSGVVAISTSGFFMILFALVDLRQKDRNGSSGLIALVAGSVLTVLLVILFNSFAFSFGESLVNAFRRVAYFFVDLYKAIERFILYLLSFFTKKQGIYNIEMVPEHYSTADGHYSQNGLLVALLFSAFGIAVVTSILIKLSRLRLGGFGGVTRGRRKKERMGLWKALKKLFASAVFSYRCSRYIAKNRNYPVGLYLWIKRKMRNTPLREEDGESVRAYVKRLSEYIAPWEDFVEKVEAELYSPLHTREKLPYAAKTRRKLGFIRIRIITLKVRKFIIAFINAGKDEENPFRRKKKPSLPEGYESYGYRE